MEPEEIALLADAMEDSSGEDGTAEQQYLELFSSSGWISLLGATVPVGRNSSVFAQRLYWSEYCDVHVKRGTFKRRLRMTKESFDKLLLGIYDQLSVDETAAKSRGGPIIPELCLYCTIRYLAGGSYLDICDVAGISKSSFYRVIWKTMKALNSTPSLDIKFPQTRVELSDAMAGFTDISAGAAITNCVGVVDGYLARIKVPSKKEAGNVRSYFSGHYQCYGVNVQAVADHKSRFTYIGLAAPGVTADRDAIEQCHLLYEAIEALPFGVCIIGDAAYEATEHMVPVFQGLDRLTPKYNNFNFYASQLRIRVEMAFGMMQSKWGILQRPLSCGLKNVGVAIECIGRLHNYCINERLLQEGYDAPSDERMGAGMYLPSMPMDSNGDPIDLEGDYGIGRRSGNSDCREWMVDRVTKRRLVRPAENRL